MLLQFVDKKLDDNFPRRLFCTALLSLCNVELRACVTDWLRSQAANFHDGGISKLVHRLSALICLVTM